LASLDDLRVRADSFLRVSALATTFFAVMNADGAGNGSSGNPVGPVTGNGQRVDPTFRESGTNGLHRLDAVDNGNGTGNGKGPAPYPDRPENGRLRLRAVPFDGPPRTDMDVFPAITSPNGVDATVGLPLMFSVITKGALPVDLAFADNNDGSATLCGTPRKTGVYRIVVKGTFGKGTKKYVVAQTFTLRVCR